MKNSAGKRVTRVFIVLAVIVGCNQITTQQGEEDTTTSTTTSATTTTPLAQIDSTFSDASISPGGTGGVAGTNIEGTDDVELPAAETRSFFTAFQIDPVSEDSAGPKFVVSGDVDQDGLLDLVSAWNQSQPVQLHLQRRDPQGNISFRTITLAGTSPVAIVGGLAVGQINGDGWLDVVILVKGTGSGTFCPTPDGPVEVSRTEGEIIVLFNPGTVTAIPDGDSWTELILVNPLVADRWIHNQFPGNEEMPIEEAKVTPENSGFTSLVVADIDGQPGDEIVVALNTGECEGLGQKPPVNTVDLWINPGGVSAETASNWGAAGPGGFSGGLPITLMMNLPQVKDIKVMDVDDDGDLDVVATWTNSLSGNILWARNPLTPSGLGAVTSGALDGGADVCLDGLNDGMACPNGDADCVGPPNGMCQPTSWRYVTSSWDERPVGHLDTGADMLAIGDIDQDGFEDVVVRSTLGQIVQWFRRPQGTEIVQPEFPPSDPVPDRLNFPWPVFTLTEFNAQEPSAIGLGDLTGNGVLDLVLAVEGGVWWYEGPSDPEEIFGAWAPNPIIQDEGGDPSGGVTPDPGVPGAGVGVDAVDTSTSINALLVVDLDEDGRNDIIGTLDRRSGAGLSDDRLVWYRSIRTEETTP